MNGSAFWLGMCSRARSETRIELTRRVAMMRSTALVPKPGTRSNSSRRVGFVELEAQPAHGAPDRAQVLLWREFGEARFFRHLDIDGKPVGIFACFRDQRVVRFRDGLQVDVTAKVMLFAKRARHADHLLHGVVGAPDDAGGQEQPFDIVAAIEIERQLHHLVDGEARPRHVR
jgi:hypothetical protein